MRARQSTGQGANRAWGWPVPAALTVATVAFLAALPLRAESYFVIVEGLGGEPSYQERFSEYAGNLEEVCKKTAGDESRVHLLSARSGRIAAWSRKSRPLRPREPIKSIKLEEPLR